jgi:hypothetical protein
LSSQNIIASVDERNELVASGRREGELVSSNENNLCLAVAYLSIALVSSLEQVRRQSLKSMTPKER